MSRTHHHGRQRKRLKGLNPTERAVVIRFEVQHEDPVLRKAYQRAYRQKERSALQRGEGEDIPRWRPSRGWLTW